MQAKIRRIAKVKKVRDLYHCPMYRKELKVPCSYPTEFRCRNIIYVDEDKKNSYVLCAYRVRDLGLDNCIKEAEAIFDWDRRKWESK